MIGGVCNCLQHYYNQKFVLSLTNIAVTTALILVYITTVSGTKTGHGFPTQETSPNVDLNREFSYTVSIRTSSFIHRCGGSIIAKEWILTAAHCVLNYLPSLLWVVVNSTEINEGGQYFQVSEIICHNNYSTINWVNDIAVLRLTHSLVFEPGIRPIQLESEKLDVDGYNISGWSFSYKLRFTELKTIDNIACRSYYKLFPITLTSSQFCTMSKLKRVVRQGDSGSPLIAGVKQIGIVSWGFPPNFFPDVHTKVSSHYGWIQSKTNRNSSATVRQRPDAQSFSANQFDQNRTILLLLVALIFGLYSNRK